MAKKNGLIICGFPGVGKSSCAGWENCIDLESSYFSQTVGMVEKSYFSKPMGMLDWTILYTTMAIKLAEQGYTIFVSTHAQVIWRLIQLRKKIPVIIFAPCHSMKEKWTERLEKRYAKTNDPKDLRALKFAQNSWDTAMADIENCGLPVVRPSTMDYDLKDYIHSIRFRYVDKKE